MTSDQEKEGVVIDVAPEPDPDAGAKSGKGGDGAGRGGRRLGLVAVAGTLALVVALAMSGIGYWHWTQLRGELDDLERRLGANLEVQARMQASIEQARGAVEAQQQVFEAREAELRATLGAYETAAREQRRVLEQRERQLAAEQLRLETREAELREAVDDMHRRIGRSGSAWMVAEAEYLIRLAGHRLELARDALTARAALELADERLRDTLDPAWAPVRARLARDIDALAAAEPPDLDRLGERLAAVKARIPELEPARPAHAAGPAAAPPEAEAAPRERGWDTLVGDFMSGMTDAVRIRRNDGPVPALPLPEHEALHRRNLELRLETARLALALGEPGMYRRSLGDARAALREQFRADADVTQALLTELEALAAVDIRPPLPAADGEALRLLQAERTARQGRDAPLAETPE
jgi:uroporphyrin-3 C-methyltransferase